MLQTEFSFTLPYGYVDADGEIHREGIMRMATAMDEIAPLKDRRVQSNPGYLTVILLSRVVMKLGDLRQVTPKTIEDMYAGDLAYLQELYQRINLNGNNRVAVTCPYCEQMFEVELDSSGE
jgi:hypothetical protein